MQKPPTNTLKITPSEFFFFFDFKYFTKFSCLHTDLIANGFRSKFSSFNNLNVHKITKIYLSATCLKQIVMKQRKTILIFLNTAKSKIALNYKRYRTKYCTNTIVAYQMRVKYFFFFSHSS